MIAFRVYICPVCGYSAWAMDNLKTVRCHNCGAKVRTKEQKKETGYFMESAFKKLRDTS